MDGTDSWLQQQHRKQLLLTEQPGGVDESPVFGIPALPCQEHQDGLEIPSSTEPLNTDDNGQDDDDDSDFEFASASNPPTVRTADEIFSDGRIRPVYPVFDRELFFYYQYQAAEEEGRQRDMRTLGDLMMMRSTTSTTTATALASEGIKSTRHSVDAACSPTSSSSVPLVHLTRASSFSSSDADDLDGVPTKTFCLWAPGSVPPSPHQLGRKSRSTGSTTTRRWRLRDLVLGRSHSDGKQKLMFFHHGGEEGEPKGSPAAATGISSGEDGAGDAKSKNKVDKKKKSNENKDQGKKKAECSSCKDHLKAPPLTQRKKKPAATELDIAMAHRLYYNNNTRNHYPKSSGASSAAGGAASADTHGHRRPSTFLPYRKDLFVGIFPHSRRPQRAVGLGFHQGPPSFYGF